MKNEMKIGGYELTPKQEQAIIFLARGFSINETAKRLNISAQTIYNWKTNSDFLEDLKDETRAYLEESRMQMAALAIPAIETLSNLLDSDNPNIQLKAAREILKSNGLDELSHERHLLQGLGLETDYSKERQASQRKQSMLDSFLGIEAFDVDK